MTVHAIGARLRTGARAGLLALGLALGLLGTAALAAVALPPDGAGPDSPGTSSRVWPTQVKAGDRLNFQVSGYPANETVYFKIDDGTACSDTSHGACVYATQKLDSSGSATGSIVVPDLAPGTHWLRILATGDVFDPESGEKLGYEGYTRRGGNDFTVVAGDSAGTSAGSTSGGTGGDTTSAGGQPSTQAGQGATTGATVEAGEVSIDIADTASPSATAEPIVPAETASAEAVAAAAEPSGAVDQAAAAPQGEVAAPQEQGLPIVGVAVLGGCVVLGAGALTWALLHRRRLAAAAALASPRPPQE